MSLPFPLSSNDKCIRLSHSEKSIFVLSVELFISFPYNSQANFFEIDSVPLLTAKSFNTFSGTNFLQLLFNIARIILSISLDSIFLNAVDSILSPVNPKYDILIPSVKIALYFTPSLFNNV